MEVVNEMETNLLKARSRRQASEEEDGNPVIERGTGKEDHVAAQATPEKAGKSAGQHHAEVSAAQTRDPIADKAPDNKGPSNPAAIAQLFNFQYALLGLRKQSHSADIEDEKIDGGAGDSNHIIEDNVHQASCSRQKKPSKKSTQHIKISPQKRIGSKRNSLSAPFDAVPLAATESKVTSILKQPHLGHKFRSSTLRPGAIRSSSGDAGGQQPQRPQKNLFVRPDDRPRHRAKHVQHSRNFLKFLQDFQKLRVEQVLAENNRRKAGNSTLAGGLMELLSKAQGRGKSRPSKLMMELENYDPQPSAELQRKIDFYITPYNQQIQIGKHMTFDEPKPSEFDDLRRSRSVDNQLRPGVLAQKAGESYWTFFLKRLFNEKNVTLKQIKSLERQVLLQGQCDQDYMTKLDLIDTHPALFTELGSTITPEEIEQLRILVVGDRKLFGSRKPSDKIRQSEKFQRLQKKMMPTLEKILKDKMKNDVHQALYNRFMGMKMTYLQNMKDEEKEKDLEVEIEQVEAKKPLQASKGYGVDLIGDGALMGVEGVNDLSPLRKANAKSPLGNSLASKDKQQQPGLLQGLLSLGLRKSTGELSPAKPNNAFEEQKEGPSPSPPPPQEERTLRRMRFIKFKKLNEQELEASANDGGKQRKASTAKRPGAPEDSKAVESRPFPHMGLLAQDAGELSEDSLDTGRSCSCEQLPVELTEKAKVQQVLEMQAGKNVIVKYKSPEQKEVKKKIKRRDFVKMNIKMNKKDVTQIFYDHVRKCITYNRLRAASPRLTSGLTSTAPTRTPTRPTGKRGKDKAMGNFTQSLMSSLKRQSSQQKQQNQDLKQVGDVDADEGQASAPPLAVRRSATIRASAFSTSATAGVPSKEEPPAQGSLGVHSPLKRQATAPRLRDQLNIPTGALNSNRRVCFPIHEEKQSVEATQRNLEEMQTKPLAPKDESGDSLRESLGLATGRDEEAPGRSSPAQVAFEELGCHAERRRPAMPAKIQTGMAIELAEEPEELQKIVIDPPKDGSFASDGRMASGRGGLDSSEPGDQRDDGHPPGPSFSSYTFQSENVDQEGAALRQGSLDRNEEDVLQADNRESADHRYRHREMDQAAPYEHKEDSLLPSDSSNARREPSSRPQQSQAHQSMANEEPPPLAGPGPSPGGASQEARGIEQAQLERRAALRGKGQGQLQGQESSRREGHLEPPIGTLNTATQQQTANFVEPASEVQHEESNNCVDDLPQPLLIGNFMEQTKKTFEEIRQAQGLKSKSLEELLEATERSYVKQKGFLKELKIKKIKMTGQHTEFLKATKEQAKKQTKRNFKNGLHQLKQEVEPQADQGPMTPGTGEEPKKKQEMKVKQLKTLKSLENVQNMILSSAPRQGKQMQDLVLDRNEFTKQRFPDRYVCCPSAIMTSHTRGPKQLQGRAIRQVLPRSVSQNNRESIGNAQSKAQHARGSQITPQIVGQPVVNQTEWEYRRFYTENEQQAQADRKKEMLKKVNHLTIEKPPRPQRMARIDSKMLQESLEQCRGGAEQAGTQPTSARRQAKTGTDFIRANISKTKQSQSTSQLIQFRKEHLPHLQGRPSRGGGAPEKPLAKEQEGPAELDTDLNEVASATQRGVFEALDGDFRLKERASQLSLLIKEPLLREQRPSLDRRDSFQDFYKASVLAPADAPTPLTQTRSPTAIAMQSLQLLQRKSSADNQQYCLAISKPLSKAKTAAKREEPRTHHADSRRQTTYSLQSNFESPLQSQANPLAQSLQKSKKKHGPNSVCITKTRNRSRLGSQLKASDLVDEMSKDVFRAIDEEISEQSKLKRLDSQMKLRTQAQTTSHATLSRASPQTLPTMSEDRLRSTNAFNEIYSPAPQGQNRASFIIKIQKKRSLQELQSKINGKERSAARRTRNALDVARPGRVSQQYV